ncbi:Universal stress protein [Rosistilla carotiformis]|uniref:Universal stress protein n=1 Tax=Rosistilla carotiformis TaxID=2528017 RepID=A0A518JYJ4_9BACT|nr:universal stress protein [Rosistilla carotiformis]QDV70617.1 Universal stress protein [Rosistilla carotiformis]
MKILFATDGSCYAAGAARFIRHLQSKGPMELTVLTVSYTPENTSSPSVQPWLPEWRRREHERIDQHHAELRETLKSIKGTVTMELAEGNAARCILERARELDADLIVMGARGHSTLERLLLGSLSDSVATHADCSVLIVRPPELHAPVASDAPCPEPAADEDPVRKIELAYDGSSSSKEAVNELMRFQWPATTEVSVLSVIPTFDFYGQEYGLMVEQHDKTEHERVQTLCEQVISSLSRSIKNVESQTVMGDHVGDAIVRAADENQSQLIVLGDNGHGLIGELLLGSTTKYVLRHAHCSVWISRHHRTQAEKVAEVAVQPA